MAGRDEILDYAAELLDLASFADYGPQGMQVAGAEEVTKVVCAVSSSLELFERAAAAGAQLVIVHHGILWENEPRTIDERVRRRLQALFDAGITLAAYHLALDAHPEIGNNALLARELGVEVDGPFSSVGVGGRLGRAHRRSTRSSTRVRERIAPDPLVFAEGPDPVERVAILSGGGGRYLADAARERVRPLPDGRARRAEPAPRPRARHHLRRRRPLRDRAARRPGAGGEARRALRPRVGVRRAPNPV